MSDGYEPYAAIAEQHRLVHLGCWAHCRRYFHEALQALPKDKRGPEQLPARFIELIGRLYKVEAELAATTSTPRRCSNSERCTACRCSSRSRHWRCSTCTACCPAACWARRCTTSPRSGPSSCATSMTAATDRQQRLRKRDPPVRRRAPQLVVRRHGGRRERQRQPVLAAADLPGQRDRWLPVPPGAARRVAQGQDRRRLRGPAALAPCAADR